MDIRHYDLDQARKYKEVQEEFYRGRPDSSRILLYSRIPDNLEGKRVWDLGCGFGRDVKTLSERGAIAYGIDLSGEMIELAREEYPELKERFRVANFNDVPFNKNSFDLVFSRYALHLSLNLRRTFEEVHRVLVPGGKVYAAVAHPLCAFVAKQVPRVYWEPGIVDIKLYHEQVTVKEPSHMFRDYWKAFEELGFKVRLQEEHPSNDNYDRECEYLEKVPDFYYLEIEK